VRVVFSPAPTVNARYSKHVVRMPAWLDTTTTPAVLKPGLVVSEPDTMALSSGGTPVRAGKAHFYFLDWLLTAPAGSWSLLPASWTIQNDFMDDFGVGVGPEDGEVFGRWMEVGNFTGSLGSSQLVVTASDRDVPDPLLPLPAKVTNAGAAVHLKQP
jgi:hypothetical protein